LKIQALSLKEIRDDFSNASKKEAKNPGPPDWGWRLSNKFVIFINLTFNTITSKAPTG